MSPTPSCDSAPASTAAAPAVSPPSSPLRCLTIDVEEYFQIEAAHGTIARDDWAHWPGRTQRNLPLLLDLFDRHNRKGTFFFLGGVARQHPDLVRRVAAAGHEIASHGTGHDRLHRLNPQALRQDLLDCKHQLEDQIGRPVLGYRAPTFSVVPQTAWAIDVLVETGFQYDASIFPVRHPWYGVPAAPDRPFRVQGREGGPTILEVPPLTWSPTGLLRWLLRGRKMPVAGGGYFRLLPLWFMRRGLLQAAAQGRPAVLYFHPWEFDPDMPRMPLKLTGRIRTYKGLRTAAARLSSIMAQPGRWSPIAEALPELRGMADEQPVLRLDLAGR